MYRLLNFSLFFLGIISLNAQRTGSLDGIVKDGNSQLPISGVRLSIASLNITAYTDSTGYFRIKGILPGYYAVSASNTGYITKTEYNVQVSSGNTNTVNFFLEPEVREIKGVSVKGKLFRKVPETPLSVNSLSAQEVKSFPGANFDIVKVAQSLPGVSGALGFRNDLIIRGGGPNESVYYLDGIEVPNINHFATQGSGGGPVGILNVSFIDEVTLSTSAFHARYDNPLSGVLQFRQKTGNKEKTQGNFRLGASEAAITLEGPLGKNKKLTYLASVRRSYLQFLFRLIDLPFLPDYWDYQYKVTWKPNKKNEISLIGLNAIDNFTFNPPVIDLSKDKDEEIQRKLYILNSVPKYTQYSAVGGINWRRLLKKGYINLAVSSNVLRNKISKYERNDENNEAGLIQKIKSYEWEHKLRFEIYRYEGSYKFNYGFNIAQCNYTNDFFARIFNNITGLSQNIQFNSGISLFKAGAFVTVSKRYMDDRLNASAGLRTDGNNVTQNGWNFLSTLSPRLNISYALSNKININASIGKYYKIPTYTVLGYRSPNGDYPNLNGKYITSVHYTTGLEWLRKTSQRITLEGFYKLYNNYPVSELKRVSLANLGGGFGFVGNEKVIFNGKGETYGVELSVQQKLDKHLYGIFSYTWFVSRYSGMDGNYIPSAWDNRHLATFTGGYKFRKNWELGTRFRFLGSAPYTPFDTAASINYFSLNGQGILDFSKFNTLRFSPFFSIDIRIDKKWNFKKWSLDLFLDIQNLTASAYPSQADFTYRRDPSAPDFFLDKQGNRVSPSQVIPGNMQYLILNNSAGTATPSLGVVVEF